jgi:DNA-binding Xre family transcriptional regulator
MDKNVVIVLNSLLKKAAGDIENLSFDDLRDLQQFTSMRLAEEFRAIAEKYYPRRPLITALLNEEMHRRRVSQMQLADIIGIKVEYLNKLISGKTNIGMLTAEKLRTKLDIDGNYLMDIAWND